MINFTLAGISGELRLERIGEALWVKSKLGGTNSSWWYLFGIKNNGTLKREESVGASGFQVDKRSGDRKMIALQRQSISSWMVEDYGMETGKNMSEEVIMRMPAIPNVEPYVGMFQLREARVDGGGLIYWLCMRKEGGVARLRLAGLFRNGVMIRATGCKFTFDDDCFQYDTRIPEQVNAIKLMM